MRENNARAEHTPGLLHIEEPHESTFQDTIAIMGGETGEAQIAAVYPMGDDDEVGTKECRYHAESLANARRLVTCWNCHDDLVAACREALKVVDECYEATGHIHVAKTSNQRMLIDAALAKAGRQT